MLQKVKTCLWALSKQEWRSNVHGPTGMAFLGEVYRLKHEEVIKRMEDRVV